MKLQNRISKGTLLPLLLLLTVFTISSCNDNDGDATPEYDIQLTETSLGNILTDGEGRSLYFFTRDVNGTSACEGGCVTSWPVFNVENPRIPASLNASYFGTITRGDGQEQMTYKGWPLYYFANDAVQGDVNGENVGGSWYVAKPDYDVLLATQSIGGQDARYLVDATGNTLYRFQNDGPNESNCNGGCLTNWPIFSSESFTVPSALNGTDFGSFDNEGTIHATFNNRPLYYFANDAQRGDLNGHEVGNVWFVEEIQ